MSNYEVNKSNGDVCKSAEQREGEEKPKKTRSGKLKTILQAHLLIILTLTGVVLGFSLGFAVRLLQPSDTAITWIGMPGELWMRMLKLMILPLIVTCVISGTAALDPKCNGKISLVSFVFIITTNILGCLIAIVLALIMKPGVGLTTSAEKPQTSIIETEDIFTDLLRNLFPDNIIEMTFSQTQTKNEIKNVTVTTRNATNETITSSEQTIEKTVGKSSGTNLLGVILTCSIIGIAAGLNKPKTKTFLDLLSAMEFVFLQLLKWLLWITPIGVFSLIMVAIVEIEEVESVFLQLGLFVGLVTIGIAFHQLILMPGIFFAFTRRNPFYFFIKISRAWLIGLASTSTAVALPEMVSACENAGVEKRVSRFVIPFCVALNADGSALFISAAAMFIGNMAGVSLDAGDVIVIVILTAVATLALPSVPSSSIVTLLMVLTSINVPTEGVALLFAVEWFLDRIRTSSNVLSHTFCAVVTHELCKNDLAKTDDDETQPDIEMSIAVNIANANDEVNTE